MNDMAHSNWGGSICKRYRTCPGSVAACAAVPKLPASSYAMAGTAAHDAAEFFLTNGIRHITPGVEYLNGSVLAAEDARAVQVYLDAVYAEVDQDPDAVLMVEQRFVLPVASAPVGTVFGRNDALVYLPTSKKLIVLDYKHGFQPVDPTDNDQGKFYGAGAALSEFAKDWPIREVEIIIVQPNSRDVDTAGAVKRWSWSPADLLEFFAELEADIAKTQEPDAPRVPGQHCRWCDAAPVCEVRAQLALEAAQLAFTDVALITPKDLPKVEEIDVDRMVKIRQVCEVFEAWGKKIEERMMAMLETGQRVPGFKLVEKQARRKWQSSGDEVAGYLAALYGVDPLDVMPPTLATITEVEKLLALRLPDKTALKAAKDDVSLRFTVKESSGTTIAPEHDRRDAIIRNPAAAFGGVNFSN
jgi:hypothetical protein